MAINTFQKYAFVGIGSNLESDFGSPKDNVLRAIEELKTFSEEQLLVSAFLETKPLDCPPGSPDFINAVVALIPKQNETPLKFLYKLQAVENSMGRLRSGLKNETRIIDLDLLLFMQETYTSEVLALPHPEIIKRDFVLEPLKELVEKNEYARLISFLKVSAKKTPPLRRS